MAEENQDEKKPSRLMPILKWIGIGGGLLTVGVVAGYFVFSPAGDVIEKEELEQMIERSIVEREEAKAAEEAAAAGPEKVSKDAPEERSSRQFTTNLLAPSQPTFRALGKCCKSALPYQRNMITA